MIFPSRLNIGMEKAFDLRYGENPEQTAAFYTDPFSEGVSVTRSEKLHGKELSYNNILDLESALELVREFSRPTAVVIKHTNPCGIASSDQLGGRLRDRLQRRSAGRVRLRHRSEPHGRPGHGGADRLTLRRLRHRTGV